MRAMTPGSWMVLVVGALLCFVPWMILKRRRGEGAREVRVGAGAPIVPWLAIAAVGWLLAAWLRSKWGR